MVYVCFQCFDTVGQHVGHLACKKWGMGGGGGHWLVRMEWRPSGWSVCLPLVNLPLHHKVQKFSSGISSPGWSRKKGHETVVDLWWWWWVWYKDVKKNCSLIFYKKFLNFSHFPDDMYC